LRARWALAEADRIDPVKSGRFLLKEMVAAANKCGALDNHQK
jgi:hypothetical protein